MFVIAKYKLGADARNFSCCACALNMTKVAQKLNSAGQTVGYRRIGCATLFQLKHIENLTTRGKQPAQSIGKREGHPLPLPVIQLVSRRVRGFLKMLEGPQPHAHGGRKSAG